MSASKKFKWHVVDPNVTDSRTRKRTTEPTQPQQFEKADWLFDLEKQLSNLPASTDAVNPLVAFSPPSSTSSTPRSVVENSPDTSPSPTHSPFAPFEQPPRIVTTTAANACPLTSEISVKSPNAPLVTSPSASFESVTSPQHEPISPNMFPTPPYHTSASSLDYQLQQLQHLSISRDTYAAPYAPARISNSFTAGGNSGKLKLSASMKRHLLNLSAHGRSRCNSEPPLPSSLQPPFPMPAVSPPPTVATATIAPNTAMPSPMAQPTMTTQTSPTAAAAPRTGVSSIGTAPAQKKPSPAPIRRRRTALSSILNLVNDMEAQKSKPNNDDRSAASTSSNSSNSSSSSSTPRQWQPSMILDHFDTPTSRSDISDIHTAIKRVPKAPLTSSDIDMLLSGADMSLNRLDMLYGGAPIPMMVVKFDTVVIWTNMALSMFMRLNREDMVGVSILDILRVSRMTMLEALVTQIATELPPLFETQTHPIPLFLKPTPIPTQSSVSPTSSFSFLGTHNSGSSFVTPRLFSNDSSTGSSTSSVGTSTSSSATSSRSGSFQLVGNNTPSASFSGSSTPNTSFPPLSPNRGPASFNNNNNNSNSNSGSNNGSSGNIVNGQYLHMPQHYQPQQLTPLMYRLLCKGQRLDSRTGIPVAYLWTLQPNIS